MKWRSGTSHKSKKEPSLALQASVSVSLFLLFALFPASLFTKKESNQTGHMSVEISMTTLVKMYPCDLILNKCYVPNFGLFINGVAREAFVVGSCAEIKIWLERVWRNCLPCVYGTETIPTPVQTCLDAIHPVFNLYHSEGEDKHFVPCNCDYLSTMLQISRTWSLVLGNSYRLNIWTLLKTYLSDSETITCERERLGQKQGCLVSNGVNLSSLFRWRRTLGSAAKSTYATSVLPACLTTLKQATYIHSQVTFALKRLRFQKVKVGKRMKKAALYYHRVTLNDFTQGVWSVSWSFMLPLIGPHSSVKSGLEIPYEDTCC